jgi:hypothetical protein
MGVEGKIVRIMLGRGADLVASHAYQLPSMAVSTTGEAGHPVRRAVPARSKRGDPLRRVTGSAIAGAPLSTVAS